MHQSPSQESESLTFRQAIRSALREELERDEDVFLMGEDIADHSIGGIFNVTQGLSPEFGERRVRDTPISEAGINGLGVGAALTGLRPVVEIMFSDFIGVGFEQIMNQAGKLRFMHGGEATIPITIRTTEGAGTNSAAQHSSTLHTLFGHLPGIKVAIPATPASAKGLLKASIRSNDPVVFFENKLLYARSGEVPVDDDFTIPLGQAEVVRSGSDVTVVATQRLLHEALALDDERNDVSMEIIDPRSIYPLDTETIAGSVRKTGRILIADGSPLSFGTHAEIGMRVIENCFFDLEAPVVRVGNPDVHVGYSRPLEDEVTLDTDDIERGLDEIV